MQYGLFYSLGCGMSMNFHNVSAVKDICKYMVAILVKNNMKGPLIVKVSLTELLYSSYSIDKVLACKDIPKYDHNLIFVVDSV